MLSSNFLFIFWSFLLGEFSGEKCNAAVGTFLHFLIVILHGIVISEGGGGDLYCVSKNKGDCKIIFQAEPGRACAKGTIFCF